MFIVNGIILILMLLMIVIFFRSIGHKQRTIEIYRKSSNEVRQGPIPSKYEHGQAQGEEGSGLVISGRVDQGQGGHHRRRTDAEDDQAQKSEGWAVAKE
jgi:hypothetical protein